MTTKLIGFCVSAAVAVYVVLCGLAKVMSERVAGEVQGRTIFVTDPFTFWHPALLVFVGAVLSAVLISFYEPPPLTRDEREVLERQGDSL